MMKIHEEACLATKRDAESVAFEQHSNNFAKQAVFLTARMHSSSNVGTEAVDNKKDDWDKRPEACELEVVCALPRLSIPKHSPSTRSVTMDDPKEAAESLNWLV